MKHLSSNRQKVINAGKTFFALFLLLWLQHPSKSQESVFFGLKSDLEKADHYYRNARYENALQLYLDLEKRKRGGNDVCLKIADSYFKLSRYNSATFWYGEFAERSERISPSTMLQYAEALSATNDYEKSVYWYREYLKSNPGDRLVLNKIWRLKNSHFLYEDSAYYAISFSTVNSEYSDIATGVADSKLVFLSNRPDYGVVKRTDAANNKSFYRLYQAAIDPLRPENNDMEKPGRFAAELNPRYHQGPVAFYDNGKKMVCILSSKGKQKTLQVHFAEEKEGNWFITESFPYNSGEYSINAVAIAEDGRTLYFSSDAQTGFGGKDLYKSTYRNGSWTKPENLGDEINTSRDETFPFFQNNTLYFASNGHAGLGGLDVYKVTIEEGGTGDVVNMGYPINTPKDDFGLYLDSTGTRGHFSSNRKSGGLDDDIYEVEMNLQSYPLTLHGTLKFKITGSSADDTLKVLPHAFLEVIDLSRNLMVQKCQTNASGRFVLEIPYYSQYKIRVKESGGAEMIVSLDIPKYRKAGTEHEIVVVKDAIEPIPQENDND